MAKEYTLGGPPPQSRSEKILMKQNPGRAQSRIEELLKNATGRTSGALVYKGTVETALSLPSSGNEVGDVYHVNSDGSEWAWNGSTWEELGMTVDLSDKQDKISDLATIRSNAAAGAAKISCTEATVAGYGFTKNTGTYSKPNGGIPASDLAAGVIPTVPQMATQANMSDWTSGKTVDAGALKTDLEMFDGVLTNIYGVLDAKASATGGNGAADKAVSIPMGHLDSTSTATVMTATVDGITELRDGVCMWLRNGVITSASGFTLNVNGLGAKPCYSSLAAASRSTTIFNVDYTMLMVYNEDRVEGGCWDIVYGVDTNTTYTPVKLGFGYGTCTTAAATAAKTASISSYALTTGGIVSIHFSNDVPANATLNISSKGSKAIYYRGAAITADVIKGGDTATFIYSTYYHLIGIDRQYLTLADLPIYNGGVT